MCPNSSSERIPVRYDPGGPPTIIIIAPAYQFTMAQIEIRIELKKGVADPEGKNTTKTLESLGFGGVSSVKTVKVFDVEIDATPEKAVEAGEEMCKKLLANPVIQNYKVILR